MCQDCVRSLTEAPTSLCITRDTMCVCVCVCVCAIVCSPYPPLHPSDVHSPLIYLVYAFVKIVSNPWPSLHPPCISRGTLCVCVCVCLPLPAPPTPNCIFLMFIANKLNQWVLHTNMHQDCVRSAARAPSTL